MLHADTDIGPMKAAKKLGEARRRAFERRVSGSRFHFDLTIKS
ncbi:hypothetical protein V5F59_18045 [Xanthobacter autotrophicus DSM 431]